MTFRCILLLGIYITLSQSYPDNNPDVLSNLTAFYHSLSGSQWIDHTNWLNETVSYCTWYGIYCLDDTNEIFLINLQQNNLTGVIPERFSLNSLEFLALDHNQIHHLNPLGDLGNLSSITMVHCGLTGEIPDVYYELPKLSWLDLSMNALSGEIKMFRYGTLEALLLKGNNLTGVIPDSIGIHKHMRILELQNNQLSGKIPDSINNLTQLEVFIASNNRLMGFPDSFQNMDSLSKLILGNNLIEGQVPPFGLGTQTQLRILILESNKLSGTIPDALYEYNTDLSIVNLEDNDLEGSINPMLQNTASAGYLVYFSVRRNPRMKNPTSMIPSYFTINNSTEYRQQESSITLWSCHTISVSVVDVRVDPEYFDYEHCGCLTGYYGYPPDNCYKCFQDAECSGGSIQWEQGYYPEFKAGELVGVTECPDRVTNESACSPGGCSIKGYSSLPDSCQVCDSGREGRLCTNCLCDSDDCFFFKNGYCALCPFTLEIMYSIIILSVVLILITLFVFCVTVNAKATPIEEETGCLGKFFHWKHLVSGHLKIGLIFLQSFSGITNYTQFAIFQINTILDISTGQLQQLGLMCAFPQLSDPEISYLFEMLLPVGFILLFVIASLIGGIVRCCCRRSDDGGYAYLLKSSRPLVPLHLTFLKYTLVVLYFFYFTLAGSILDVFNCHRGLDGNSYMESRPWIQCDLESELYRNLVIYASTGGVVYIIGIPLLFTILLLKNRNHLREELQLYWLGSIYSSYKEESSFFEIAIILRRLSLAVVLSLIPNTSIYKIPSIFSILIIFLIVQLEVHPFKTKAENRIEVLSFSVLVLAYASKLSIDGKELNWEILSLIIAPSVLGALLIIMLLKESYHKLKHVISSDVQMYGYDSS
eukprot:TRINITY_DN5053_c0_g1_i1.p1 TRINITY_DN5053_c0_g1~~TRINITY_DN5053_c0_g1_i1.p1  ORF type:complete len:876 (-),score=120.31 TRINITY_DN5053_c0_g1_i1:188-2815(-)